ncbi:MAG: hypothetical protein AAF713_09400 [Pseudomonadota bacterium]
MPIRVEQTPEMVPGEVQLVVSGAGGLDHNTLQISILRIDLGSARSLNPDAPAAPWASGEQWIAPARAYRAANRMTVPLGPAVTWHLKPHMPYLVRLRDGMGAEAEDRMSWPVIRLPAKVPSGPGPRAAVTDTLPRRGGAPALSSASAFLASRGVADPRTRVEPDTVILPQTTPPPKAAPQPEPAPSPELDPLPKAPELEAPEPLVIKTGPPPKRGGGLGWIGRAAIVLFLSVGTAAALWAYSTFVLEPEQNGAPAAVAVAPEAEPQPRPEQAPEEPKPRRFTVSAARAFLQSEPSARDAAAEADRYLDGGASDAAFLLRSYAAKGGHAGSARIMGDLYNPSEFTPGGVVKSPNSDRAAEFYERAARSGDVPAMRALGELLRSGTVARDDAPERAQFWLRRAANAGDQVAKELLQ